MWRRAGFIKMEDKIIFGILGFSLGYLARLSLMILFEHHGSNKKILDNAAHFYPPSKASPNKVFIERSKDRRAPNQEWAEQVSRAYGYETRPNPVLVKRVKP